MKKIFTASLLILVGFTLTGCTLLNQGLEKAKGELEKKKEEIQTQAKTNLEDLFALNQTKKCTYSLDDQGKKTIGTVYIKGQEVAHNLKLSGDKPQEINYIMKGDWMYTWGTDTNIPAMKMQLSELAKLAPKEGTDTVETKGKVGNLSYKDLGLKAGLDLVCEDWKVDEKMFFPPENITFTDVTKTMRDFGEKFNQTTEKVKDLSNSKCSACNMAPDENLKKECLASLGCN